MFQIQFRPIYEAKETDGPGWRGVCGVDLHPHQYPSLELARKSFKERWPASPKLDNSQFRILDLDTLKVHPVVDEKATFIPIRGDAMPLFCSICDICKARGIEKQAWFRRTYVLTGKPVSLCHDCDDSLSESGKVYVHPVAEERPSLPIAAIAGLQIKLADTECHLLELLHGQESLETRIKVLEALERGRLDGK